MSITDSELDFAAELALRAAYTAAVIINKAIDERSTPVVNVDLKSNSVDLVTKYDKQCEEEVLTILQAGTPHYGVVSEETHSNVDEEIAPVTWVVDPIDGTTSFVHGLYDCCVSIGLVVNGEPVLGVVSAPRLQEVFVAIKGRGAFCNGQRIHVSATQRLEDAVVCFHQAYNRSPECVNSVVSIMGDLAKHPVQSVRNNGAAALDMCYVAAGRADMYFEVGIHSWDYAAGTIIIREAGGVVHDVEDTETFDLFHRKGMCCGSHKELTKHCVELAKKHNYRNNVLNTPN